MEPQRAARARVAVIAKALNDKLFPMLFDEHYSRGDPGPIASQAKKISALLEDADPCRHGEQRSDARGEHDAEQSRSSQSPGVGWSQTTDNYYCHPYAVHKDIDDQVRANADSNFRLDKESTEFVTNQLLLKRDLDWNATYFKAGVWDVDLVGGVDFTNKYALIRAGTTAAPPYATLAAARGGWPAASISATSGAASPRCSRCSSTCCSRS